MTLIADASPLILLGKISLLEKLLNISKVVIPEKVYREITIGKEKSRFDAFLVDRLVQDNKIRIEKIDRETYKQIWKLFGLWAGEAEVLGLALKTKQTIITDDKKCMNASRAAGVEFITSLDVVIVLYKKRHINKKKALEALGRLEDFGWYKKDIIKSYRRKIK